MAEESLSSHLFMDKLVLGSTLERRKLYLQSIQNETSEPYTSLVVPFKGNNELSQEELRGFTRRNENFPIIFFPEDHTDPHFLSEMGKGLELLAEIYDITFVSSRVFTQTEADSIRDDEDYNAIMLKYIYLQHTREKINACIGMPEETGSMLEQIGSEYARMRKKGISFISGLPKNYRMAVNAPIPNVETFSHLIDLVEKNPQKKLFMSIGAAHILTCAYGVPLQEMVFRYYNKSQD